MALPREGGLFGIGKSLSFRSTSSRYDTTTTGTSLTAGGQFTEDTDDFIASRRQCINSRKIQQLSDTDEMSRYQRNKSYSSSVSLILNRSDDVINNTKPARVQRSHTTLGLGGGGGGGGGRYQSTYLNSRSTSSTDDVTTRITAASVARSANKRRSCINFGSEFLLDTSAYLKDSDDDEDGLAPLASARTRRTAAAGARPASTVFSGGSACNGGDADVPSLTQSFRRSSSFHHTIREPTTNGTDTNGYSDNNNNNNNNNIINNNKRFSTLDSADFASRLTLQASEAAKEAADKRQALVDQVLNYKNKTDPTTTATAPREEPISFKDSIRQIEAEVKARFNDQTSRFRAAIEQPPEEKKPFQSRFLKRVQGYDDDDWSEHEWKRFIDAGILLEIAVEQVVLLGRTPKPNFEYESDTPPRRPYHEDPDTTLVSNPPTPKDKYGRKSRDRGGLVPDHHTWAVVPQTESPKGPRRWQSERQRLSAHTSRQQSVDSRRQSLVRQSSSSRRQSVALSEGSCKSTPSVQSGPQSRRTSNIFDDEEPGDEDKEVGNEEEGRVVSTATCSMKYRDTRSQTSVTLNRYNRLTKQGSVH